MLILFIASKERSQWF